MAEMSPSAHHSMADDMLLQRETVVNVGKIIPSTGKCTQWSRRTARSPGMRRMVSRGRGSSGAAGIICSMQQLRGRRGPC
jgi:hypothetical protein